MSTGLRQAEPGSEEAGPHLPHGEAASSGDEAGSGQQSLALVHTEGAIVVTIIGGAAREGVS